jgi:hypothetical protein
VPKPKTPATDAVLDTLRTSTRQPLGTVSGMYWVMSPASYAEIAAESGSNGQRLFGIPILYSNVAKPVLAFDNADEVA